MKNFAVMYYETTAFFPTCGGIFLIGLGGNSPVVAGFVRSFFAGCMWPV